MNPRESNATYYYGFDYIRAIFSCAVVSLHCSLFSNLQNEYSFIYYIIRYHFEFLAVPVFFTLSLTLFINKKYDSQVRNIKRLFLYYCVWGVLHFWMINPLKLFDARLDQIIPLLLGCESPLYFLFNLVLLMVMSIQLEKYAKYREISNNFFKLNILLITLCIIMLLGNVIFQVIKFPPGYNNVFLYMVYIPLALIIINFKHKVLQSRLFFLIIGLTIFFGVLEYYLSDQIFKCGPYKERAYGYIVYYPYARITLCLQALLIVLLSSLRTKKPPKIITFLSGISLVHSLVIFQIKKFLPWTNDGSISLFLLVFIFSCLLCGFFKRVSKKIKPYIDFCSRFIKNVSWYGIKK